MAPPKDIARSYPKRGLTADVGFRSEPKFCGDGSAFFDADYATGTLSTTPGSSFSYGLWMNVSDFVPSNESVLMTIGTSGVAGGQVTITLTSTGRIKIFNGSTFIGQTAAGVVSLNTWHFIAVTVDGTAGGLKIYSDGIEVTGSHTATFNVTNSNIRVGAFGSPGTYYADGNLANVFYCTEILTQDQVRQIMRFSSSAQFATITGMESFYPLSADFNDAIGSANLTNNGATLQPKKPQLPRGLDLTGDFKSPPLTFNGDCVSFDGSSQGANVATTYDIAATGAKTTIAAWVNFDTSTVSSAPMIVGNTSSATSRLAIYQTATNTLMAGVTHATGTHLAFGTPSILSPNRWYFCAATFDKDTATLKFYLDGLEFDTVPVSGGGATAGQFEIGARYNGGSPILHFDGKVAHAMMIEDVLTQGEIVELMRDTTYAKAQTFGTVNRYYELDADFNDDTGSHNATSYGSPTFTTIPANPTRYIDPSRGASMAQVYSGRCVDFDGSADELSTTATLSVATVPIQTFCVWVKPDTVNSNRGIVVNGLSNSNDAFYLYQYLTGYGQAANTSSPGQSRNFALNSVKQEQWQFLCGVYDATDPASVSFSLYVDGVSYSDTAPLGTGAVSGFFKIGRSSSGYFDGSIAHVKVFDVALTQTQIRELYHNPEQVLPTGVSASNLRRYYPLSDYNDTGGTGGRYFQDMGVDGKPVEDLGSANMEFAQPVPCPQLGLQQSATRLRFPGGNTTHNAVATTAALGTTASVSCWFQVENTGVTRVLWAIGNATGTGFLEAFVNSSDQLQIYGQSGFQVATITDSDWHHLVVMTDSGSPPYKVFLDNSEVSLSGSDTARNLTNGTFEIGNQDTAASPFVFQGILNDVACWNTELGSSDVSALYNSGVQGMDVGTVQASNLKGWWKCDDLRTLKDYSGNGANATVTNTFGAASFPENASGSTIVGDFTLKRRGVSVLNKTEDDNDVLAIIPASADVFPTSQGFTLSVWLRGGQEASRNAYIIATTNRSSAQRYGIYTQSGSSNWGLEMPVSASPTTADAAITYDPNEWACLSFTLDFGTNTVKMYTNGALQTTVTRSLVVPTTFSDINVGGSGAAHATITGTTPIALFKTAQRTWSDDEVERNYYSDLRLIKGLDNE